MTTPDRDPLTIARETVRQHEHLDQDGLYRREKERLDLARAVIAAADLADAYIERYDRRPDLDGDYPQGVVATAKAIRAALNGDTP